MFFFIGTKIYILTKKLKATRVFLQTELSKMFELNEKFLVKRFLTSTINIILEFLKYIKNKTYYHLEMRLNYQNKVGNKNVNIEKEIFIKWNTSKLKWT